MILLVLNKLRPLIKQNFSQSCQTSKPNSCLTLNELSFLTCEVEFICAKTIAIILHSTSFGILHSNLAKILKQEDCNTPGDQHHNSQIISSLQSPLGKPFKRATLLNPQKLGLLLRVYICREKKKVCKSVSNTQNSPEQHKKA